MKDMNDIVENFVADMEIPADVPVVYEVWAIGYDEEGQATNAELLLGTFEDPDFAVSHAKAITLADIVHLTADDSEVNDNAYYISIEVETVVPDEDGTMNIGTIYKKKIEVFEELPEFVVLTSDEYEVIEETGNIQIPCNILKEYNKNDLINLIFDDEEEPWPITYKIISKTTSGHYICGFL
jgi:hypothetical protein